MSSANANRPHQRWTLCESALLPSPSTLKLGSVRSISLPHANNEVMLYQYRKGGCNRERNLCIPRISPPPAFCTEAKVAKGGAYLRDTMVLTSWRLPLQWCRQIQLFLCPIMGKKGVGGTLFSLTMPCTVHFAFPLYWRRKGKDVCVVHSFFLHT